MSSRVPIVFSALAASTALLAGLSTGIAVGHGEVAASGNSSVELTVCSKGKKVADRWARFRGEMTQITDEVSDAARMQMRFSLSQKVGTSVWFGALAPGLDVWREARPDVTRFVYNQRVLALERGTAYRMTTEFRWLADDGEELRRETDRSKACRQPGKLPNLKIRDRIFIRPGPTADTARYAVKIGNTGFVAARPTELTLRVDGAEVDTRPVGRLLSTQRRTIRFVGPVCATSVEAEIDPRNVIRELTEKDNERLTPCGSPQ